MGATVAESYRFARHRRGRGSALRSCRLRRSSCNRETQQSKHRRPCTRRRAIAGWRPQANNARGASSNSSVFPEGRIRGSHRRARAVPACPCDRLKLKARRRVEIQRAMQCRSRTWNPPPAGFPRRIAPISSTSCLLIASPKPVPPNLRVRDPSSCRNFWNSIPTWSSDPFAGVLDGNMKARLSRFTPEHDTETKT